MDVLDPLIIPDTAILPVLVVPKVNPGSFEMPPVIVNVLVPPVISVLILEAEATVMVPDRVAACAPLTNLMAPPVPDIPNPFIVIASGIVNAAEVPLISKAAPDPTIVFAEPTVPNALLFAIWMTPAVIDVVPA